jgi:solute carrier family 35 protein C2
VVRISRRLWCVLGWLSPVSGIGLFTHHKYRKSLDSTVPLDAHGNPIIDEDEMLTSIDDTGYGAQAEETIRLTSTRDGDLDNLVDEVRVLGFQGRVC